MFRASILDGNREDAVLQSFTDASPRHLSPGCNPSCLIVEDQVLIALSIETYLEEAGYDVAGAVTSGAEAMTWLKKQTPDVAIVDYSLSDGACTALVAKLRRRNIPFMIYSGHQRIRDASPALAAAPWLVKPCTRDDLVATLRRLTHQTHVK